jgi:AcrR family transcriptional regulator
MTTTKERRLDTAALAVSDGSVARRRRYSNRDRVCEAALELFNANGYSSVTTNHIAAHAGISPGNLYYHFRHKEEIVESIYRDAISYIHNVAALPESGNLTAKICADYYLNAMETFWIYRSIFGDIHEIARRNSNIAIEHRKFIRWSIERLCEIFEVLSADGRLRHPVPTHDKLEEVADNTSLILTGWWPHLQGLYEPSEITLESVRLGAVRAYSLIEPYLSLRFAASVRKNMPV